MSANSDKDLYKLVEDSQARILKDWMQEQMKATSLRLDLMSEKDLEQQSREFLNLFITYIKHDSEGSLDTPEYNAVLSFLKNISETRAVQGFSPAETATFVFSLKQPLFTLLKQTEHQDKETLAKNIWLLTAIIDKLGLYTMEQFQKGRESVIKQQQQELLELSTPVAKLWEGILVLPLIGTLDSARTQMVMENLLQKIVETSSTVAIIDITGIPMVDTMVAQHLIKTMSAARLMGAECIVSGIRPQIAQTMIHLGISMQDVVTKATLADAVNLAMQKAGFTVTHLNK
jgi:rsbT co-antagonist protein RsbR